MSSSTSTSKVVGATALSTSLVTPDGSTVVTSSTLAAVLSFVSSSLLRVSPTTLSTSESTFCVSSSRMATPSSATNLSVVTVTFGLEVRATRIGEILSSPSPLPAAQLSSSSPPSPSSCRGQSITPSHIWEAPRHVTPSLQRKLGASHDKDTSKTVVVG